MMADSDSMNAESINQETLADVVLVVEALAAFAGHPSDLETHRERRAWELVSGLADDLDTTPSNLLRIGAYLQS